MKTNVFSVKNEKKKLKNKKSSFIEPAEFDRD